MLSDRPRNVDMRLTTSVKIEALSNISLAYQSLSSKQSSESWMVARVLPRLKPLGYRTPPLILGCKVCALKVMHDNINKDGY